jgi:hypothetical protein
MLIIRNGLTVTLLEGSIKARRIDRLQERCNSDHFAVDNSDEGTLSMRLPVL